MERRIVLCAPRRGYLECCGRGSSGVPSRAGRISSRYYKSSSAIGFLYFGFLRALFGWIGLAAGTGPTRSRASLRTSFFMSNLFFRAMWNPRGLVRSITPGVRLPGDGSTKGHRGNRLGRGPARQSVIYELLLLVQASAEAHP